MTKTLLVTLEIPVRAMTEEEWAEAWAHCEMDEEEDEGPDRLATMGEVTPEDFREALSAATNSADNPEILAGTGLFVHLGSANVKSVEWAPTTDQFPEHPMAPSERLDALPSLVDDPEGRN